MVSYYMKASLALREKLKAKMQRSKARLKPSIVNPLKHNYNTYQWQLSEPDIEPGFGGLNPQPLKGSEGNSMVVHLFV
jgi:hypothetical protein